MMRWDLYNLLKDWLKRNENISSGGGGLGVVDKDGNPVEVTAEKDNEGKSILRIVDAAPYAYNPQRDTLRVESGGRESITETLVEDRVIPANSASNIGSFVYNGETNIYVAVATNQQPWSLSTQRGEPWGTYSTRFGLYPVAEGVTDTFGINTPWVSIPVITGFWDREGLAGAINSLADAKAIQLKGNFGLRFFNDSDEDATITVKIHRVYS